MYLNRSQCQPASSLHHRFGLLPTLTPEMDQRVVRECPRFIMSQFGQTKAPKVLDLV